VFQIGFPTSTIFFWNFSQLLAICFELFSSGSVFNSENHCRGVPPVSLSLSVPGLLITKPSPRGTTHRGSAATRPRPCLKGIVPTAPCACLSHAAPTAQPLASPHLTSRVALIAMSERAMPPSPSPPHRVSASRHRFLSALAIVVTSLPSPCALVVDRLTLSVSVQVSAESSRHRWPFNRRTSTPLPR
jgi:hypothetical protein